MLNRWFALLVGSIGLAVGASGCRDQGVAPANTDPNVHLSVQAAGSVLHKVAHETLHIGSVKVLLKSITLSRGATDSMEIHTGPLVVDLHMDAAMVVVAATRIAPGTYDRIRFDIHKPENNEVIGDTTFRSGGGDGGGFSVVITGAYHETEFTFTSRESAHLEILLSQPVIVTEEGNANVTFKIDPYAWFTVDGLVLDPFNQIQQIDDRVKHSFASAFKDDDRNGEPD